MGTSAIGAAHYLPRMSTQVDNPGEAVHSSPSRTVAFNAVVRGGGEVFAKLASVVFFLAVARDLGVGDFGDLMFALSFTTILTLPSGFGTEELLAREVARDRNLVHEYAANVMAMKVVLSVLLLGLAELIVVVGGYSHDVKLTVLVVGPRWQSRTWEGRGAASCRPTSAWSSCPCR